MVPIVQNGNKFQGSFYFSGSFMPPSVSFWWVMAFLFLFFSFLTLIVFIQRQDTVICLLSQFWLTGTHDGDIWRFSRSPGRPHTEHQTWRKPQRQTRLLWDDQSPLQPAAATAFLWFHRLIFEQLGKSVMWNNSLSTATATDLFPKALWAHWRYSNGPLNNSRAPLSHSPKVWSIITFCNLITN